MTRVAFVACSKTKANRAMPAAALYASPLFRKSLLAACDSAKKVFILSAKHGLVGLNDIVAPYDVTLKTMKSPERLSWGREVAPQLTPILDSHSAAIMYCGEEYIAPIRASILARGAAIETPLEGQSLGQRLQSLALRNGEAQTRADVTQFSRVMRSLWLAQKGGRLVSEMTGSQPWPERGVYFVFEDVGGLSHGRMSRIVRVGTHAVSAGSKTSLWNRLSTHRGTGAGGGSHRSSIFRSHVGRALMERDREGVWPQSWGVGQSAPREIRMHESALEELVSRTIGRMRVVWLDIPDAAGPLSDRAYIERNSIGLLSRANLLTPSKYRDWLGLYSHDWRICTSGLWNLNHVFAQPDPKFLTLLADYAKATIGHGCDLAAPRLATRTRKQLNLFEKKD